MPVEAVIEKLALGAWGHVLAFVLGAAFGSFANVCIFRLPPTEEYPKGRSVATPGSHCFACKAPVRWYDNLPILSFFILRGRCRACGIEISPRYLLVEVGTAILVVAVYHLVVAMPLVDTEIGLRLARFAIYGLYVVLLVVVSFIDLDHKIIPNAITYPAIPLCYLLGLALPERQWHEGLIGIAVGYGGVRLISDGYYYLTGREGLGYGDGKLLAVVGGLCGWQAVIFSLFLGSIVGSVIGVTALLVHRSMDGEEAEPGAARAADGGSGRPGGEIGPADGGRGEIGTSAGGGVAIAATGPTAGDADEPGEPADEALDGTEPEDEGPVSLRHAELPFGPFLATGAVVYLFLEGWIRVTFSLLWGNGGAL